MPKRRVDFILEGLPFWNPTYDEFKLWWDATLADDARSGTILLLTNPETLNQAAKRPEVRACWEKIEVFQAEGVGIRIAGRMRGHPATYNFAGTDLIPRVCREAKGPMRIFCYGATEDSNAKSAAKLAEFSDKVQVVGRVNGFVDFEKEALPLIAASKADVVLFALGTPKQELLMEKFAAEMNVKVTVTCGGLFDFLADLKPRAPAWMRAVGLEWLFRLMYEPKRLFRRYVIGNPVFLLRSLQSLRTDKEAMRRLKAD